MQVSPVESVARPPAILIVDDDRELCTMMGEYLIENGCNIYAVYDGRSGLAAALKDRFELVILDVMLPVLDGFEVLHQLRGRSRVPVIMLTARTSDGDRVAGLEAGADDYLPKPFNPRELVARVRAILRRTGREWPGRGEVAEANGIRVNAGRRQALYGEVMLPLTSVEFDILDLLVRAAGRVVSRDQIAAVLYQREASPFERSVDMHVSHLRRKLLVVGRDPIRTVRGSGYLFERS